MMFVVHTQTLILQNYATNIQKWFEVMGRENVLVVDMNEPQADVARKILELANLPVDEYKFPSSKVAAFSWVRLMLCRVHFLPGN